MKWHIVPVIASVRLWNFFNDGSKLVIFLANHKQTQRKLLLLLNKMFDGSSISAKRRLLKSIFNFQNHLNPSESFWLLFLKFGFLTEFWRTHMRRKFSLYAYLSTNHNTVWQTVLSNSAVIGCLFAKLQ